ncbi:MAG TPA: NAD(P)/FAD-dependent oxidoreductase [Mycobacterium sp.]|nr:NAD(P)/FAD-dependent oxidoreductase [Mycobacterium sp.]
MERDGDTATHAARRGEEGSGSSAPTEQLDAEYLILGAGAMGMAFADVILAEDPTARLVIVDRRLGPGGHWNDAYPFVKLHQPAAYYGLNSTGLGQGGADLTSGPEIVAYYNNAMDRFLSTGRVCFLPMTEHRGNGEVVSIMDPTRVTRITARRRIVDSTHMQVQVPSVSPPRYAVDEDVALVPPNGLARLARSYERYVIVGAGKTGIDAILFLLDRGAPPHRIQWIVPHDAWLWDRATVQPAAGISSIVDFVESIAKSGSIDEVYLQLERQNVVCRIDPDLLPTKWRCATIDSDELRKLRTIENVVRMGRVHRLRNGQIDLDEGTVDTPEDTLFVDCTANGLAKLAPQPLFSDGLVTLQSVFMCQQTFSAALIAHLELLDTTDARRNRICAAVPHPELKEDLPAALLTSVRNMLNCHRYLPLWLLRSRLYLGSHGARHRYLLDAGKLVWLYRRAVTSVAAQPIPVVRRDRVGPYPPTAVAVAPAFSGAQP